MESFWNVLSRLATLAFRLGNVAIASLRPQIKTGSVEKILVIKLDAIGDFVLSSAFLRELRRTYPNASITLVTPPTSASLAELCPYINQLVIFDPSSKSRVGREF